MANNLTTLPWVIDTTDADPLYTGRVRIDHMDYVGYANATDTVEVQDQNGNLIWLGVGNTDLNGVTAWDQVGWVDGLLVPTTTSSGGANLPSGKLIVYIR